MRRYLITPFALALCLYASAQAGSPSVGYPGRTLDLQVLDSREIPQVHVDGLSVKELSGLAWDDDEKLLYAVSDKGRIVHLQLTMEGSRIADIALLGAYGLADEDGRLFSKQEANAEGVAVLNGANGIKGDSELLVVTENGPEIARYTPNGRRKAVMALPAGVGAASGREHGLESVDHHPVLGVVTAPARPLGSSLSAHTISTSSGRTLTLSPHPKGQGKLKAIEVLPNGKMLVMERLGKAAENTRWTALRLLDPDHCSGQRPHCDVVDLDASSASLPEGNFEGLARLPNGLWAAISDDRQGEQRRSLLAVFRLTLNADETD